MPPVVAIVFSKDRPMQLEATLRSLLATCTDPSLLQVKVLYLATSDAMNRRYERVAAAFPGVHLLPEKGFQETLLGALGDASHVLFVVDDALFVRAWSLGGVLAALERNPESLGFSLRLGRNTTHCYPLDRAQALPAFEQDGEVLAFDWTRAELDFGYPLEVSSSVYRVADIAPLLAGLRYKNPNELESRLDAAKRTLPGRPRLLCHALSVAFCAPLNVVQHAFPNRAGNRGDHSPGRLAALFDAGLRIDVGALSGHVPSGCHEEIELPFTEGDRPPRVSVIVPCYGQAEFLPFAVASVVQQQFEDWEIVIVNDGSPDDTSAVARRLSERLRDRRIRLIEKENGGLASARNAGIEASRGDLVLPLDADDAIDPSFLAKTVAALDADAGASIAFTNVALFGAQTGEWQMGPFDLTHLRTVNRATCTSLFRREVWEQVGGYNPNMVLGYEDWDFWVGAAERGLRAVHVAEPLFFYRMKEQSMVDRAKAHHGQLWARLILNHPKAYSEAERAEAARFLAARPLPVRGAPQPSTDDAAPGSPAVSVVIPCYRQAEFLPFAVSSVVMQTFTDWEIVIVDDGSPDDTAQVAERLKERLPDRCIRIVRQENAGLSAARNAGIRASRGRYVVPLDADDAIDPKFLERTVSVLESDASVAVVGTDGVTFGAREEPLHARPLASLDSIRHGNSLNYCSPYRREVWEALGGYNPNMVLGYEDWDFWIGAKARGFGFAHVAEPLFFYRAKAESMFTTARKWDRHLRCRIALNHPSAFGEAERAAAEAFLASNPLPRRDAPRESVDAGTPEAPPSPLPSAGARLTLPSAPVDAASTLHALRASGRWNDGQPLRLHLGCGERYLEGYVNVDLAPSPTSIMATRADVFGDVAELRFPTASVDEVRSHHVFEHFPRTEALALLIRWHEWLRPGGRLVVETPDLEGSARTMLSDQPLHVKTAVARHLAGDQSEDWAFHVDHWFPARLEHTLARLGFGDIRMDQRSWPHPPFLSNVTAVAVKARSLSREELLERADELLTQSLVSSQESPTLERWRRQLRTRLSDGPTPRPAASAAPGPSAALATASGAVAWIAAHGDRAPLEEIVDFNQRRRDRWVADRAASVPAGARVLDVGAGTCPYRPRFAHCQYLSHDFKRYEGAKLGGGVEYGHIDLVSDVTAIPVPDASFDVVLCTEVLEHVPRPEAAVREMARLLRPGGRLLLSAPLGSGLHQLPFHYFGGFSPEWYREVVREAGLEIVSITPNGGFFRLMAQEMARAASLLAQSSKDRPPREVLDLLGEHLPRWFHALDDVRFNDQFTVGYFVEALRLPTVPRVVGPRPVRSSARPAADAIASAGPGSGPAPLEAGVAPPPTAARGAPDTMGRSP